MSSWWHRCKSQLKSTIGIYQRLLLYFALDSCVQLSDFDVLEPSFLQTGLSQFVGPNSWLIFSLLDLNKPEDLFWLKVDSASWKFIAQFNKFKLFCEHLKCVNDSSERAVKLVSEFINCVHNEEDRQDPLLAVQQKRDHLRGATNKEQLAEA